MDYYYLICGEIYYSVHEIPKKEELKNPDEFDTVFSVWKTWLEKCKISSIEYEKLINNLNEDLFYPVDVTDFLINENGKLFFKDIKKDDLETVFRNFIRMNHLSEKWENYLKQNNIILWKKQTAVDWLNSELEKLSNQNLIGLHISWSIVDGLIKQAKEIEKEQLCDFYIRGRNEQHLDYYPEKHANEEYDLIFNKKENGQD